MGIAPLDWDPAFAADAAKWARHLAVTGKFEHAPENAGSPEGENLWAGTKGYYSAEAMSMVGPREALLQAGKFPGEQRDRQDRRRRSLYAADVARYRPRRLCGCDRCARRRAGLSL